MTGLFKDFGTKTLYYFMKKTFVKTREQKEKELIKEILRSLLLEEDEKNFWLENIQGMPESILDNVTQAIHDKNKIVDEYMAAALKNDPDHQYLAGLKAKIKKIKETAFAMDQSAEQVSAEENLEKQIQNL